VGVLDKIIASKRTELPELRGRRLPVRPTSRPSVSLKRAPGRPLSLICEIKKRSPSAGALSTALSVSERAKVYENSGASMLSVLCDGPFFDGSYEDLSEARKGTDLPLLCKEFIVDPSQLDAADAYGASAILLIVRCLNDKELSTLVEGAKERQLVPLVEIFNEEEAKRALDAGAEFIGVNARDLDTLEMDSERANRIVGSLPDAVVAAHLSGVKAPTDVRRVAEGRADAALIGEVLMREDAPGALLSGLSEAAKTPRV